MERTEQAPSELDQSDIVYQFELTLTFESPPLDELETVPLFDNDLSSQVAASDTTGN